MHHMSFLLETALILCIGPAIIGAALGALISATQFPDTGDL